MVTQALVDSWLDNLILEALNLAYYCSMCNEISHFIIERSNAVQSATHLEPLLYTLNLATAQMRVTNCGQRTAPL
jgi:hypothetical protein